jgi:hypothetical protein
LRAVIGGAACGCADDGFPTGLYRTAYRISLNMYL